MVGTKKIIFGTQDKYNTLYIIVDKKRHRIHKLVADLFIPKPVKQWNIAHINGDLKDNRASNLEYRYIQESLNPNKLEEEPVECICHTLVNYSNLERHMKSLKHNQVMANPDRYAKCCGGMMLKQNLKRHQLSHALVIEPVICLSLIHI